MESTEYKVKRAYNCILVFGAAPVSDILNLGKAFSKKAVMDAGIADRIGATWVAGEREDIEELRKHLDEFPLSEARQDDLNRAGALDLPSEVVAWLASGERGLSSNAMCHRFYGVPARDDSDSMLDISHKAHPHDPADFRRCVLFLDATGSHDKLPLMRDVSPQWAKLVDGWEEIHAAFKEEIQAGRRAPKTYDLIKKAVC